MDAVRISHLRMFANAVASALQHADSRQVVHTRQLQNMLGAFARSVDASLFIAESAQVSQMPMATSTAVKLNSERARLGALVTVQKVKEDSTLPAATAQNKPVSVSDTLANHFFLAVPWKGLQYAVPRQQNLIKRGDESAGTHTTAASFFASLPWRGKLQSTELHIGAGADHAQQAAFLAGKLAPQALPTMFSHGMPLRSTSHTPSKLSSTNPMGYFSRLPWAGRQASRKSQN